MNVVQLVKDGKAKFEWSQLTSEYNGYKLHLNVLRDAMKFDEIPAMTWDFKPVYVNGELDERIFNGVRLPASAGQLQEIADLVGGMLLTPKIIDLIYINAKVKFDSIVNSGPSAYTIVAIININDIHEMIEDKIESIGDDGTGIVECVGKYWCLIEDLNSKGMVQGDYCACNYGWLAKSASGPGVTPGTQCWQRPGFAHNKQHWDPSQTIRLMHPKAVLEHPDGTKEDVDLHDIANNVDLCGLIVHTNKPLTYLRQEGVEQLEPLSCYNTQTTEEPMSRLRAWVDKIKSKFTS